MSRDVWKWPSRFLDMAELVAKWSKDPSTQVGAVITDTFNRVLGVGYNGLPRGVEDSDSRLLDREVKLALTLHAEDNAMSFAAGDLRGSTMYVTRPPCSHCAAKVIQRGIGAVFYPPPPEEFVKRWSDSLSLSKSILQEGGVRICEVPNHLRFTN